MNATEKLLLNLIRDFGYDVGKNVDWDYFIEQVKIHKVGGLLFSQLSNRKNFLEMPSDVRNFLKNCYNENIKKYHVFKKEFVFLVEQCQLNNLHIIPVKGVSLIQRIYDNPGERTLNDFDFLLPTDERGRLIKTLVKCGYVEGELDEYLTIKPIRRKSSIYTKLFTDGLDPFYKIVNNKTFMCDVRMRIHGNADIVRAMIQHAYYNEGAKRNELSIEDELIYLSEHLYREATSIASIYNKKDLILIKFIDIYNFFKKYEYKIKSEKVIETARKYDLEASVFFTFYYLNEIYQDSRLCKFVNEFGNIHIEDIDVIGKNDLGKEGVLIPQKNFWERLFSISNSDEVRTSPHWANI